MNILEKRIKEKFFNEDISVIAYTTMKESASVKCNKCNSIYTLAKAENFLRKSKKCICPKCINNGSGGRLDIESFQRKINAKYPDEKLKVLNYTLRDKPSSIQCLKCGSITELENASSFLNKDKKRVCKTCFPNKIALLNNKKKEFLKYIESQSNFKMVTNISSNEIKTDSLVYCNCSRCGHMSGKTMDDYLKGKGCSFCANNRLYSNEEYQKILGEEYTLLSDYKGMEHTVLLKHNLCGFCYKRNARHYTCPKCSGSKGEKAIAYFLQQKNIQYIQEKTEIIEQHKLRFDFYLPQYDCYIEFQGEQHFKPIGYFGGKQGYLRQKKYDNYKLQWAEKNNKKLLLINYDEDIKTKLFNFLLKFNDHLERE